MSALPLNPTAAPHCLHHSCSPTAGPTAGPTAAPPAYLPLVLKGQLHPLLCLQLSGAQPHFHPARQLLGQLRRGRLRTSAARACRRGNHASSLWFGEAQQEWAGWMH